MIHAAWHALSIVDVLAKLETSTEGLSEDEATARLRKFGPNRLVLPPTASVAPLARILHLSPLGRADWIVILAFASVPAVKIPFIPPWRRDRESRVPRATDAASWRRT